MIEQKDALRSAVGPGARDPQLPRAVTAGLPREEPLSFADHLFTLYAGRAYVLGVTLGVVAVALVYLVVATPIYRTNVLLQVEESRRSLAGLEDISQALGERAPPGESEMEILRSRTLVGSVVDQLGRDVSVSPHYFPLVGTAIARSYDGADPAPARLGLSGYSWGGDRMRLGRIEVSGDLVDARLRLTALPGNRFRVTDPDGVLDLQGEVGKVAAAQSGSRRIELFVVELVARPGVRFDLVRRDRNEVIEKMQKALRIEERGRRTGILSVSLDGPNPQHIAATLDAIASTYLRHNVERKSAETASTLAFVESQLPIIKASLDEAQGALNAFQVKKGTIDLTAEAQAVLQRSADVEKQMSELEMQRSELRQRFTDKHPAINSLREKLDQLRAERATMAARMRTLPETEGDAARHQRDVKVSNELYSLLLNKAQELRVVKSGTVGNIRILDRAAISRKPISPMPVAAIGFSLLLGITLGVATVFVRKALAQGADDPEAIEQATGLPIYAMVPRSPRQAGLGGSHRAAPSILAAEDPGDAAVESLRSLRTSLQFALVESHNNVVAIGGPVPGVGKSFVAINLAFVLATTERRVLLVDADLRRGSLHRHFGTPRRPGLSDLISGAAAPDRAIHRTAFPGLDVLPTGRIPPNPSELLASQRFQQVIGDLGRRYDLVVVDTPPVLAVTDAMLVARFAGVNLLVLRSGEHPMREISLTVKRMAQSGIRVQGAVLNDVRSERGRYGRFGRYQRYEYRSIGAE